LNSKASKQSVSNALHRKANKHDVESTLSTKADLSAMNVLSQQLDCKMDLEIFEKQITKLLDNRGERNELFLIKEQISLKADMNYFESIQYEFAALKQEIMLKQAELNKDFEAYVMLNNRNIERVNKELENKGNSKDTISRLNDLEIKLNSLWNHAELERSKSEFIESKLSAFASVEEVRIAMKEFKTDFLTKIGEIREDVNKLDKFKAGVDATNDALSQKADAYLVEQFLERKADKVDIESCKNGIEHLNTQVITNEKYEQVNNQLRHALEEISKDMSLKSNIKDVCKLLDLKANTK